MTHRTDHDPTTPGEAPMNDQHECRETQPSEQAARTTSEARPCDMRADRPAEPSAASPAYDRLVLWASY
jgi:hypothetical protein